MSKKSKQQSKDSLPAAAEFAMRHGIKLETARAILEAFRLPQGRQEPAVVPDE